MERMYADFGLRTELIELCDTAYDCSIAHTLASTFMSLLSWRVTGFNGPHILSIGSPSSACASTLSQKATGHNG
jgi:hypothetical protein